MVSVDQAYMVGHMKNADGSINNKNVVLSAACEAAELFQCMMAVNQKLEDWQRFNHTLEMHLRSVECEKIHDICQAVYGMKHPSDRKSAYVRQIILSHIERHSKKPDVARDRIVELIGDVPRIELFARQTTPGWDVWGNEIQSDIEMKSEEEIE